MGRALIRLTWSHLVMAVGMLLMLTAVVWIALLPSWPDLYAREFGLPRLEDRYGFQFGAVSFTDHGTVRTLPGIASVNPGSAFERMGIRPRDIPFEFHGGGSAAMYQALVRAESGEVADFGVINADDLAGANAGPPVRTIRISLPSVPSAK